MPIIGAPSATLEIVHHERADDAFCFKSNSKYRFTLSWDEDYTEERSLEIRLYQIQVDSRNDPLENLLQPLEVLLIEDYNETRFEDVYYFSCFGDFLRHGWRKQNIRTGEYIEDNKNITKRGQPTYDGDISKLFRYGEQIRIMMGVEEMRPALEKHPTVQRLKNHTLWKHPTLDIDNSKD